MMSPVRVADPPSKPLMIFDGDCHFCRRWIERWREQTADRISYEPSQKVAERFPEIAAEKFASTVVLVMPTGEVYSGAEAVFTSLDNGPGKSRLLAIYRRVPLFASASERAYRLVSRKRQIASALTRLLWGSEARRPTYFVTRRVFLHVLGTIYLIAFISLWVQVDGLIGEKGILPAGQFFSTIRARYGTGAIFALPSLGWLNSSNAMLHALCATGVISSIALSIGVVPMVALIVCFAVYLSLTIAGQTFLSFQWDILLLETGFLSVFLAPCRVWLYRGHRAAVNDGPVSGVALFLLKFLLFKLMFMSGVVKLTSGDDCWWNLTALDYHYWSQPLPTSFAWFADKHPEWFKKFSVAFCLFVEIVVPFFIWAPRRLRLAAAALVIALQIAIAITGNYCFFNLLTIALCLLLIDDRVWSRLLGFGRRHGRTENGDPPRQLGPAFRLAVTSVLVVTLPLNVWLCYTAIRPQSQWPPPLSALYGYLGPFYVANGYGLFRVMTKERPEIQVEGSMDGLKWEVYDFRWKPGDERHAPRWNAPHQPRLDWQMWFAALGGAREETWFGQFIVRLLQNEPAVTQLLAHNPFPQTPPRFVRAVLYQYQFTTRKERGATGAWWKRREVGYYLSPVALPE